MKKMEMKCTSIEHLYPECITCVINKYIHKHPADATASEQSAYMQEVLHILAEASKTQAIPVMIRDINNLRRKMFGSADDFTSIKTHYNKMLLEQADDFRRLIRQAEDPLLLACKLALAGNYIDYGAIDHVEESFLNQLLAEAEEVDIDEETYHHLEKDLTDAARLVFITDNCGEIVMDRLYIEQIKNRYPKISITVVVRGKETMNDATLDDADQVGLTHMDQVERVIGNGNDIMGTWLPETSGETIKAMQSADVIIAKGQANFETLRQCGLNVYYLFLCKCKVYTEMFEVSPMTGMLINDSDPRIR